jgi:hypothetical protein
MAATTQSTQRIAQVAAALNFSDRLDDKRQIEGDIQYAFIDVPITADNAAADVIDLVELPAGAILYPELSFIVVTDDMSSGAVTIDIGDAVDADRYCDGANCASVGTVQFLAPAIPAAYTTRHKLVDTGAAATTTTLIKLTFATLGATVEVGQFRVVLAYKSL